MPYVRTFWSRAGMGLLEAATLVLLPLIFCRGFVSQFLYPKTVLAESVCVLGLAAWMLARCWGKLPPLPHSHIRSALALLSAAVLLSCVNSPVPAFSLKEAEYFLCGPAWMLLLLTWERGEKAVRRLSLLATLAGTGVALLVVLQWLGHDPILPAGYRIEWGPMVARMRLYSSFGNPDFAAGYLIGTSFLALAAGLASLRRWIRFAWFVCAGLTFAALIGTGSQGAWAGLVAGFPIAWFVWKPRGNPVRTRSELAKQDQTVTRSCPPVHSAVIALVPTLFPSALNAVWDKLAGRLYLWRVSWPMLAEHPFIGSGWGTVQLRFLELQAAFLAAHPHLARHWDNPVKLHNDPLQLQLETGLLGLGAFVWLLWIYWRETNLVLESAAFPSARFWLGASAGGVTAILVNSLFNFPLFIAPTLLLLFTLLAFPFLLKPTVTGLDEQTDQRFASAADAGGQTSAVPVPSRHGHSAVRAVLSLAILAGGGFLLTQISRSALAERDYALAKRLEARQELGLAADIYRRGLSRDPLNGRLHFGLARVLYLQQDFAGALAEVRLAERTYADSHLKVLQGRIEDEMGLARSALDSYRRALALDPTLRTVQADIERLSAPGGYSLGRRRAEAEDADP